MRKAVFAENLSYSYQEGSRRVDALSGVTLEVSRGEIFGFLGPNGAGKTTTIKLILGILRPASGKVLLFGKPPIDPEARNVIGYMPESAEYYRYLTPVELLRMYGGIFHIPSSVLKKRIDELLGLVDLSNHAGRLMGGFSKGMMQKVSLAQALVNDPEILILDEPAGGLDPISRRTLRDVILLFREKGKTIFFSSHELSEVEMVSDSIGVLDRGRLVASAPLKEVMMDKGENETLESYFLKVIERKRR